MIEAEYILGADFERAYDDVRLQVEDLHRQISAGLMAGYPDREFISEQAEQLRIRLESDTVEVNVLYQGRQITIVSRPSGVTVDVSVPEADSLCVLTVGVNLPLSVTSISESPLTREHVARGDWQTWASTPVRIMGYAAGTVCALDDKPRIWGADEEQELKRVSEVISGAVEEWANKTPS